LTTWTHESNTSVQLVGLDGLVQIQGVTISVPSLDQDQAVHTVGLTKTYSDGTTAVDGLDLTVHRGEVFAILGPNGAGKSTTAGMLTTSVAPTAGRAWVAGVDVVAQPAAARRNIGVVPQHNTLDRSLSVRENLVFHGRFFGMRTAQARREADAALERLNLGHVAGKAVPSLSGGTAQRLMIARAVLHRPEVVFLDEPTSGLDPQSRIALHELVRDLNAAGQTVLLVTHDMDEADRLAHRVAVIDHGRLLALDTPDALKRSVPADTVVKVSADLEPTTLAAQLQAELPGIHDAHVLHDAVMLAVRGERSAFRAVAAAADRANITLRDVRVNEPTLESVFIHLTGKELRD
jgi:ABC-2 type transport system ATP-binding protein